MAKKNKLTPRQNRLVKNLAKGMSQKDAAIKAGYSEANADKVAHQALQSIEKKAGSILERAGLADSVLVEKYLAPALNAQETKFFQHEGRITDSRNVIAWGPRLTALDLAFRISGSYKADQNGGATKVQVVVLSAEQRPPIVTVTSNGTGSS